MIIEPTFCSIGEIREGRIGSPRVTIVRIPDLQPYFDDLLASNYS